MPAGVKVILKPGQSITLLPGQYHSWQGVPGTGDVILFKYPPPTTTQLTTVSTPRATASPPWKRTKKPILQANKMPAAIGKHFHGNQCPL